MAAELEVERRQRRVGGLLLRFHAVGRGQLGVRPFRQGQLAAFHEAAVVGNRAFPEGVKRFGQGRVETPARELGKLLVLPVRAGRHDERHFVGALDDQTLIRGGNLAPLGARAQQGHVAHAFAATAGLVERQLAFEDIHAAVGAGGRVMLAHQRGGERKRARFVGLQIQRDHLVRLGNQQVAGEGHALPLILGVRHALHEIEIAAVTVANHGGRRLRRRRRG